MFESHYSRNPKKWINSNSNDFILVFLHPWNSTQINKMFIHRTIIYIHKIQKVLIFYPSKCIKTIKTEILMKLKYNQSFDNHIVERYFMIIWTKKYILLINNLSCVLEFFSFILDKIL